MLAEEEKKLSEQEKKCSRLIKDRDRRIEDFLKQADMKLESLRQSQDMVQYDELAALPAPPLMKSRLSEPAVHK